MSDTSPLAGDDLIVSAIRIPLEAHGFDAENPAAALPFGLPVVHGTGVLGLLARLGADATEALSAAMQAQDVVIMRPGRGRHALVAAEDVPMWAALGEDRLRTLTRHAERSVIPQPALDAQIERVRDELAKAAADGRGPLMVSQLRRLAETADAEPLLAEGDLPSSMAELAVEIMLARGEVVQVATDGELPHAGLPFTLWDGPPALSRPDALDILIRRYIAAYPMADVKDFQWCFALKPQHAKRAFKRLAEDEDFDPDAGLSDEGVQGWRLLPYRDPVAEGSRPGVLDLGLSAPPRSRAPGAQPVVLHDDVAVGVWRTEGGQILLDDPVIAYAQAVGDEEGLLDAVDAVEALLLTDLVSIIPTYDIYR